MTEENEEFNFIEYARYGELVELKKKLDSGQKCTLSDENGNTALHMSSANGHIDIVRFLLSLPEIDVNSQNQSGNTPLHWACLNGHLVVVKALCEANADIFVKNHSGKTCYDEATRGKNFEVADYLFLKEHSNID